MTKRLTGLVGLLLGLALLLGGPLGADTKIAGDTKYKVFEFVKLNVDKEDATTSYVWKVSLLKQIEAKDGSVYSIPLPLSPKSRWAEGGKLRFVGASGTYLVELSASSYDEKTKKFLSEVVETEVTIEGTVPPVPPKPPDPPGPKPPVPPDPPAPSPSPIPVAGFRVLIVYDALTKTTLPKEQQSILQGKAVRDYLRAKCAADPSAEQDGKAYRIWPSSTVADTPGLEVWKTALARPRASLPWVVVSNHPSGGFEGPLPASPDAMIELLKKYAEAMPSAAEAPMPKSGPATPTTPSPSPSLTEEQPAFSRSHQFDAPARRKGGR